MKKVINAYVGQCNENDPKTLETIKQNFIASLNAFVVSKIAFCGNNIANCDISNVKVYCGKSKRSGDISRQVVSVEIVLRDKNAWNDKANALQRYEMMKLDLDATELAAGNKIVSKMGIADMHLEAYETKLACKAGEIVKVTGGDGDKLCRSSCSKQTFCKTIITVLFICNLHFRSMNRKGNECPNLKNLQRSLRLCTPGVVFASGFPSGS